MFRILRGRKRGEMKWQEKKSNFFLFIGKSKGWSDRKSGMQNGLSDIVNEWWCLWKQQHSHKGNAQSWVSSTSSLMHLHSLSSPQLFLSSHSISSHTFFCFLLLGWVFYLFWNDSLFAKIKLLFTMIHVNGVALFMCPSNV